MKTIIQKPIFDIFSSRKKDKKNSLDNDLSSAGGGRVDGGGGRGSRALSRDIIPKANLKNPSEGASEALVGGAKTKQKIKIIIDYREKNSLVASHLINLGFEIIFKELKIGDYIVKDTIIERKTIPDFISSMINGRLLKQLEELKQFENKLLILEGISKREIYTDENSGVNANAIRGFLLSILLKHKIPIIFTKDSEDTAKFIDVLSRKKAKDVKLNAGKKMLNKKEQMQFIIEGFPGIGPKSSKELLKKFSSIQNIINAPIEELKKILGKRAENFIEIISRKF